MKKYGLQASILVYTLVLVLLGVFMAIGVLNLSQQFLSDSKYVSLDMRLGSLIEQRAENIYKLSMYKNLSGSGFSDIIGCPDVVTMTSTGGVSDTFASSWMRESDISYCTGEYQGQEVIIYFQEDFSDFADVTYNGYTGSLAGQSSTSFGDPDETDIDISGSTTLTGEGIDDDGDSDNYSISSSGSILYSLSGTGYIDNDADARLLQHSYIGPEEGWKNIFWNNSFTLDVIARNPNNILPLKQLSDISSGIIYLDIENSSLFRLYEMNTQKYTQTRELLVESVYESISVQLSGTGYLQNDMTLSQNITGNEYIIDPQTSDYALFAQNTGSGAGLYQIRIYESSSLDPVYITPIDDAQPDVLHILSYALILDASERLIGDMKSILYKK